MFLIFLQLSFLRSLRPLRTIVLVLYSPSSSSFPPSCSAFRRLRVEIVEEFKVSKFKKAVSPVRKACAVERSFCQPVF
jgi:hypothetical protein